MSLLLLPVRRRDAALPATNARSTGSIQQTPGTARAQDGYDVIRCTEKEPINDQQAKQTGDRRVTPTLVRVTPTLVRVTPTFVRVIPTLARVTPMLARVTSTFVSYTSALQSDAIGLVRVTLRVGSDIYQYCCPLLIAYNIFYLLQLKL